MTLPNHLTAEEGYAIAKIRDVLATFDDPPAKKLLRVAVLRLRSEQPELIAAALPELRAEILVKAGSRSRGIGSRVNETDEARGRYRPAVVRVLFVGESPPFGGTFFYFETRPSLLRRETERIFRDLLGKLIPGDFLLTFRDLGCFLDDLCLEPVNQLSKAAKERKEEARAATNCVSAVKPRSSKRNLGLRARQA